MVTSIPVDGVELQMLSRPPSGLEVFSGMANENSRGAASAVETEGLAVGTTAGSRAMVLNFLDLV